MGRRDFQSTVADSLPRILQEQAKNGVGSIKFSKKDKKSIGKLYLRGGSIYAIELSTYNPNIVNRIATNEYISEPNREQLLNKFQDDIANLACINYVLTYQIFPEKPLMTYIKDYFLDAFDILYAWEDVNVEWRTNDEPPATVPTVPNANPVELIEKLNKRKAFLVEEISKSWNISLEDIGTLVFRRNFDDYNDPDYITSVILSLAEGQWTIDGVTEYLGLSNFNTKILVYELWKSGLVDIIVPNGSVITNRASEKPQTLVEVQPETRTDMKELVNSGSNEALVVTEKPVTKASLFTETKYEAEEDHELIHEINELEEVPVKNAFAESFYVKPETLPAVVKAEDIIPITELVVTPVVIPVIVEPVVTPTVTVTPIIPIAVTPEIKKVRQVTAPLPLISNNKEIDATPKNPIKENKMPEATPSTGSSRLRAIAEQLKAELKDLVSNIETIKLTKSNKEKEVNSLTTERLALVEQLKSIDSKLHSKNRELHSITSELSQLENDYNDSIKFTQDFK